MVIITAVDGVRTVIHKNYDEEYTTELQREIARFKYRVQQRKAQRARMSVWQRFVADLKTWL